MLRASRRVAGLVLLLGVVAPGQAGPRPTEAQEDLASRLSAEIDRRAAETVEKVIAWRRDFHQHPELSNREVRTSGIVAEHLRSLGLEVRPGVGRTGVVGILRGGRPGAVVALRADMDALPVTEEVNLPFASRVRSTYNGREVGVMHACGHDAHTSVLMGAAVVLSAIRRDLPGTVKFIFQPAEEGAPEGEEGGAGLMIKEGALGDPKPDAVFGLHVFPFPVGEIHYRPGAIMASSDRLEIRVLGRQTHGAQPWRGIDPVVAASQIVLGLQTIVSRQTELTRTPAIVTVATIHGGVRHNIIPDSVEMQGTIRVFDSRVQEEIHERIRRTAQKIAEAAGATAEVRIIKGNPVTYNDPALTEEMRPTLERIAGPNAAVLTLQTTTAEDFSLFAREVPSLFFFLGVTPKGTDASQAAPNHSPRFYVDEAALPVGVRAMAALAVDFLLRGASGKAAPVAK